MSHRSTKKNQSKIAMLLAFSITAVPLNGCDAAAIADIAAQVLPVVMQLVSTYQAQNGQAGGNTGSGYGNMGGSGGGFNLGQAASTFSGSGFSGGSFGATNGATTGANTGANPSGSNVSVVTGSTTP